MNAKTGRFKHEMTESLRTSNNSVARVRAGVLISDSEFLVREARRFLTEGIPRTLTPDDVGYLAAHRVHALLAHDDAIRGKGLGLRLPHPSDGLLIGERPPLVGPHHRGGMTKDDLALLTFAADWGTDQTKMGVAFGRAPDFVRQALAEALQERGAAVEPGTAEWHELEQAYLAATQQAFKAMQGRNAGEATPTPPAPPDPAKGDGPKLSEAFAAWKAGTLLPGSKAPSRRSAIEAEYAIRRFRELHGDVHIGAIAREQARSFVDAMWKLPTRLPESIERLLLPDILKRSDLGKYPPRASGTLTKHVTMMQAVVGKAAKAHDLAFKGNGWVNPFDGLKPEASGADDGEDRVPFAAADIAALFGSPIYTGNHRPRAGAGEAAFWLPALGLLTGARLGELCQLRLCDVKTENGVTFLDIRTTGGRTVKTDTSRRKVPLHPVLSSIGFDAYLSYRRGEAKDGNAVMFPGLIAGEDGAQPGKNWSRWFGRWKRSKHVGLSIEAEERKDFHSFRHTFKDMCREARVTEEVHDALTGHAGGKSVGRSYGSGVPLSVLAETMGGVTVPEMVKALRWLPPT